MEEKIKEIVPQYKCQSYYDDNGVLKDCKCGKCDAHLNKIKGLMSEIIGDEFTGGAGVDYENIKYAMQLYGEWVRQQTLEEVKGCVPEENAWLKTKESEVDRYGCCGEEERGWNDCRQQTIENIEKLKNKNLLDKNNK